MVEDNHHRVHLQYFYSSDYYYTIENPYLSTSGEIKNHLLMLMIYIRNLKNI